MNTVCISTKMSASDNVGGTKHRASSPLQKVGRNVPRSSTDLRPWLANYTEHTLNRHIRINLMQGYHNDGYDHHVLQEALLMQRNRASTLSVEIM